MNRIEQATIERTIGSTADVVDRHKCLDEYLDETTEAVERKLFKDEFSETDPPYANGTDYIAYKDIP